MISMNNEYLDVFMPTEPAYSAIFEWGAIGVISVVAAVAVGGWMVSGLPGVPITLTHKKYNKVVAIFTWILFTLLAGALIGGIGSVISTINYTTKVAEIERNMKHNVQEKYGAELQSWGTVADQRFENETLDQSRDMTLIFNHESDKIAEIYEIRFDKETSEPFVSEASHELAPTAEQLEKEAKN